MRRSLTSSADAKQPHWIVRNNYRLRAIAFFFVFIGLSAELWHREAGMLSLSLLALQFLVYPHLVYWRASRAQDSQRAELNNLILDSFLIGIWVAALQFPLWPSFTLWLASSLNITISKGLRGMLFATFAFVSGVLISVTIFGFHFSPETIWPTTWLMIVGMSGYLIAIGNVAYSRNQQLRSTREKLRMGEQTLNSANETLQEKLAEIQTLQAKLNEQAIRDPLTGLFNRRYLDAIGPHELARCEREQAPLSLLMMDIDHFKRINDSFGHQGGDAVLKALASLLIESVRASDIACRYGGEEFLLLLPNMPPHIALLRAEQWRAKFESTIVRSGEVEMKATLSIGIAFYPDDGGSMEELTRCADVALYRAKAEGRNRVVSCRANAVPATKAEHIRSTHE